MHPAWHEVMRRPEPASREKRDTGRDRLPDRWSTMERSVTQHSAGFEERDKRVRGVGRRRAE